MNIRSPKDAYVLAELLAYYIEQVRAINGALTEQFETRGVKAGDCFPTGTAQNVLAQLRDAEKKHV